MRILITGVGGPTPRSFAIALKKYSRYKPYEFVGTDTNPLSIGLYQKELFDEAYVVPPALHPDYWNVIEKIILEHSIEMAIVLPEQEVMVWSKRMKEKSLPCKAFIPEFSVAELLIDKARMTKALQGLGLVPNSIEFNRDQKNLTKVFEELPFPFWVRSTSGTSGLGSLKVESKEALVNWITINPGVNQFLASEFLPGRNLACKLLYFEGKLLRAACAERVNYIMAKVAPSGITGNTSFGRLLNEPTLVELAEKAMSRMFTSSGAYPHGFFTVDFKEDAQRRALITEINIRHVAFTQCFAAGGANFAEDTIRLLDSDANFDKVFKTYEFEKDLIFLRDVDALPILMKEKELLTRG
jgi:carbamoyl-phosphate synthase large subunit